MFVNHMADDRSASSIEGDIESKRGLLSKLHHAAYCQHDGHTVDTHCLSDPLCCASKRLFEHMSTCIEAYCGVPCCKGCRRVWGHYRKCRHVKACPLCSVVPAAYTQVGLSPRFLKLSPSVSSASQSTANSTGSRRASKQSSSPHGQMTSRTLNTTYEEESTTRSTSSTGAVVTPSKNKQRRRQQQPKRYEKENNENDIATASPVESANTSSGEDGFAQMPWDQFQNQQQKLTPILPPVPAPPSTAPNGKAQAARQHHRSLSLPIPPTTRRAEMPNDTASVVVSKNKPPLSPRRPHWALF